MTTKDNNASDAHDDVEAQMEAAQTDAPAASATAEGNDEDGAVETASEDRKPSSAANLKPVEADADGDEEEVLQPQVVVNEAVLANERTSAAATLNPNGNDGREFPAPFYCPITKQLIKDPVLAPDGTSYERSAILEKGEFTEDKLYPNIALRNVMEDKISTTGQSLRAKLTRLEHSMRNGFNQLVQRSAIPMGDPHVLPQSYYCSITLNIMHMPVTDPEGNTYEKAAIVNWVRIHKTSPLTRTALVEEDLYENHAIEELLESEKQRTDDSLHPSIRRWKEEEPPKIPERVEGAADDNDAPPLLPPQHYTGSREREQSKCNTISLFLAMIVVLLFVPYGSIILTILLVLACCLPSPRTS